LASRGSKLHAALNQGRWRRVRREVLERDNWECQCGNGPAHYGQEVDHIKPLQFGGAAFDLDNLQTLSRGCHILKSRREAETPIPGRDAWRELVARMAGNVV
jgi:5-methylcytosine-specific restriction endonuclease McrA